MFAAELTSYLVLTTNDTLLLQFMLWIHHR